MSECSFTPTQGSGGGVCRKHFRALSTDGRCDIGELVARAEAAEAEVARLTAALADRDRRIEAALAAIDRYYRALAEAEAEVERLTAEHSEAVALGERLLVSAADWKVRAQSAEAEVERLTALLKAADDVVASQDRRIAAALDLMDDRANSSPGYPLLERVLRGETDE